MALLVKAEDAAYTYQELRTQIGLYVTSGDVIGMLSLINSDNILVVTECDPRVLNAESQINTKSIEQLYNDYLQLKIDLAAAGTIDNVLMYFTSTNANLAGMSSDFEDMILTYGIYTVADPIAYIQGLDLAAIEKDDDVC